jgi:hypothetical protein
VKRLLIVSLSALVLPAAAFAQDFPSLPGSVSPGNAALIGQIGSGNSLGLDQSVNSGASGNDAGIYQGYNDAGNSITYTSTGSAASITQAASGNALNMSRTMQFGSNQTSAITQNNTGPGQYFAGSTQGANGDGVEAGSSGNRVTIQQQVTATGTYLVWPPFMNPSFLDSPGTVVAVANIWQWGQNGVASINQTSPASMAELDQGGTGNDSAITQAGGAANFAKISQEENSSGTISIQQSGASGLTNNSYVYQYSNNATVTVVQYGALGSNTSNVTQNAGLGFDQAYITQDGKGSYTNSATLTQQDGGYANVYQQSNYGPNNLVATQIGAGNVLNVRQR